MQQRNTAENEEILLVDERSPQVWFDFQAFEMDLDPYEFRVYAHLARRCSRSGRCWERMSDMASQSKMSERKFRDGLRTLQSMGMIRAIDVTGRVDDKRRKGWAITRVESWKQPAPPAAIEQTTGTSCRYIDKQPAPPAAIANLLTDQEDKKDQEERYIPTVPQNDVVLPVATPSLLLADDWHEWATTTRPYLASLNVRSFAKAIEQLQTRHSITDDGMTKVFRFVQRDPFWSEQAISPCGLLKRSKNGLYKMENLLASMKTDRSWQNETVLGTAEFDDIDF